MIISAAIIPGTRPQHVSNKVIRTEPQPLSRTARGGKRIQRITRIRLITAIILLNLSKPEVAKQSATLLSLLDLGFETIVYAKLR